MKTIFVAEDSPVDQRILYKALEPWHNQRIVGFSDGLQAYREVLRQRRDLMIMDIIMPTMSGLAVTNLLKIQEEFSDLPVLIVSSITDADVEARALSSGADVFLPKPLPLTRVRQVVGSLLER